MLKKIGWKGILSAVGILFIIIFGHMLVGMNDAGYRTVIQYPNGTLDVKFKPGWYFKWFGTPTVYKDVITFDFDRSKNAQEATLDEPGIHVRYQDGGTGTIYGLARYRLPDDIKDMLQIHNDFRSNKGLAYKLLKNTTEEIMNQTAGLMTSEDSYASERSTFTQWAYDQLENGKYVTTTQTVTKVQGGNKACLDNKGNVKSTDECSDVKVTTHDVPVIAMGKNGQPEHLNSDLKDYNIGISTFNIIDWSYEPKTLAQIAMKRQAEMAIITARANAARAKQDAITAEQQGKANVMEAKYKKEVEKAKAIVVAQQDKEVAVIKAQQSVAVAQQGVLAATQNKLAALQDKAADIARGEGEATKRRLIMQADGGLTQKLDAYVAVNKEWAKEAPLYKGNWVPGVMMGGAGNGNYNGAQALMDMLSVKTAKDLNLSMKVGGNTAGK